MELRFAVAKTDQFGAATTGDTVETTERPNGGISIILADGQEDARDSKAISTMVSHKVIEFITQGYKDSIAVRSASNWIYQEYSGRVSANLNILTADLQTNTIVISRNNPVPVFLVTDGQVDTLSEDSVPIGTQLDVSPSIVELSLIPDMLIIMVSDGVYFAGQPEKNEMDILTIIKSLVEEQEISTREIADTILNWAIRLDNDRPKDDMSVIVMLISHHPADNIRRMFGSMELYPQL